MNYQEIKDMLAIPTLFISLVGLSLSLWTAYQVGRLDFERKRQDLLSKMHAYELECDSREHHLGILAAQVVEWQPENVDFKIMDRVNRLLEKIEETQKFVLSMKSDCAKTIEQIESASPSLSKRVYLEQNIGLLDRMNANINSRGVSLQFEHIANEVSKIDAALNEHSTYLNPQVAPRITS
jgi:hypothetical protein